MLLSILEQKDLEDVQGNQINSLLNYLQYSKKQDKMAKQTLAHEILHTCPDCLNHQTQWKSHVNKMNRAYGYKIERTNSCQNIGVERDISKNAKYIIECQKCHTKGYKDRISGVIRNPEKYHCKCGGRLAVS